jgi:hypothetical protein
MLFYYGREYKSALVGKRLIPVRCDRCGCEYYYELARVGSGNATAHYGIGSKRAERAAEERARLDLNRRLERDAELVPCPRCQWTNEELVERYRRNRYRGWWQAVAAVGSVGTIISLLVAWFLSLGPAADRGAVPFFLASGPAISLTAAASILLARSWLRGRIQPNRDHPLPPSVPHGSPPPLIANPTTGELEVAGPPPLARGAAGEWIEFQIGRNRLPPLCCECLDAAPADSYRYPVAPAVELAVPVCSTCSRRRTRRMWLVGLTAFGVTAAAGLLWFVAAQPDELTFWVVSVLLGGLGPLTALTVAYIATSPVRVKVVDASRGILRLRFRNDEYASAVAGLDATLTRATSR